MELTNKLYKGIEEYVFHFDHSVGLWLLVSTNIRDLSHGLCLCDFLTLKGISIPDDCTYCFYRTDCVEVKFREIGAYIHIFIKNLNYGQNPKNRD